LDPNGVQILPAGSLPDAGGPAYLAFGPKLADDTPVVASLNSNDPAEKVWTGLWEAGAATSWAPVLRDPGFFLADWDQSMGVVLTRAGCVVHFGSYGYLGVQAARTEAARPAVPAFRIKDVQRFATGPGGDLWAVTTAGGVARWAGPW
jgi:hypothetical protein